MLRNFHKFFENISGRNARQSTVDGPAVPAAPAEKSRPRTLTLFITLLAVLALSSFPVYSQDFSEGFGGDFSEGFSSDEPSTDSQESEQPAARLEWGGFVSTTMRSYIDPDDPGDSPLDTYPEIGLDLHYSADNSEAVANLRFHRNWLYDGSFAIDSGSFTPIVTEDETPVEVSAGHQNVLWYLQQMIDEAYLRLFYDHFDLQAGFLKEVWGTGDQSHVVDLLNPTDYYDYVNIDYIDRKLAEFMFKLNIPFGMNGLVEMVYVPTFTPDSSPIASRWTPQSVKELESFTNITPPEDKKSLEDGQAALRISGTAGGMDLAGTYYLGYLRQPGFSNQR